MENGITGIFDRVNAYINDLLKTPESKEELCE